MRFLLGLSLLLMLVVFSCTAAQVAQTEKATTAVTSQPAGGGPSPLQAVTTGAIAAGVPADKAQGISGLAAAIIPLIPIFMGIFVKDPVATNGATKPV